MPREAPVTIATLPSSRPMYLPSVGSCQLSGIISQLLALLADCRRLKADR
jgi:hypothetical protein